MRALRIADTWSFRDYMRLADGCSAVGHPRDRFPLLMEDGSQRAACIRCIRRLLGEDSVREAERMFLGEDPSPQFDEVMREVDRALASLPIAMRDLIILRAARQHRTGLPS